MSKRTLRWQTLSMLAFIALNIGCAGQSWAVESAAIAPRFYDSSKPIIKRPTSGPVDITFKYPIDAIRYANFMKMQLSQSKHKCNFHTDGQTFTINDETAKKSWTIRSKEKTNKKENPQVAIILTELFPKNPYVFFDAARHYEKQKDWTKAHESYVTACRLQKGVVEDNKPGQQVNQTQVVDAATDAYYQSMMGHYATAIKEFDKAIAENPQFTVNYKNRALAYRKLNKIDLALADEKKVEELKKEREGHRQSTAEQKKEMLGFTASMHARSRFYEQAIVTANDGLKADPKNLDCLLARAQAEVRMGRHKEALADFKQCLSLSKDNALIKEEADSAAALLKDGLPPYGDIAALPAKTTRRYALEKNGKVIPITINEIAADHKGDLRVYAAFAAMYQEKSDWKNTSEQLNIMARIEPRNTSTLFERIEAAQAVSNWPLTEKLATEYLGLLNSGKSALISLNSIEYVYMIRGLARTAQKNYAGAIADQSNVIRLDPTSAQALRDRSANYEKTNKSDLARQDNSAAIKLGPPD